MSTYDVISPFDLGKIQSVLYLFSGCVELRDGQIICLVIR